MCFDLHAKCQEDIDRLEKSRREYLGRLYAESCFPRLFRLARMGLAAEKAGLYREDDFRPKPALSSADLDMRDRFPKAASG